jgi:hypothetical protein
MGSDTTRIGGLPSPEDFEALIAAAVRAPSGDNTQPWRFTVDRSRSRIAIWVDPDRDLSPMNTGQRMARMACGAALENLVIAARARGIIAHVVPAEGALAAVLLRRIGLGVGGEPEALLQRVSNRRSYDGRRLPAGMLSSLVASTPPDDGVATKWIADRARLPALARTIGAGDALVFAGPARRQAFLGNLRWRLGADHGCEDGLTLGTLEVSAIQALMLRLVGKMPDALFKACGGTAVFAAQARKLVASASGLCVIAASASGPTADLAVGRAVQRAWLALTRAGACAQPMMSLPVLENVMRQPRSAETNERTRARVGELLAELATLVPELGGRRAAFILRFGFAPAPSARTGRRPVREVVDELSTADTAAEPQAEAATR